MPNRLPQDDPAKNAKPKASQPQPSDNAVALAKLQQMQKQVQSQNLGHIAMAAIKRAEMESEERQATLTQGQYQGLQAAVNILVGKAGAIDPDQTPPPEEEVPSDASKNGHEKGSGDRAGVGGAGGSEQHDSGMRPGDSGGDSAEHPPVQKP